MTQIRKFYESQGDNDSAGNSIERTPPAVVAEGKEEGSGEQGKEIPCMEDLDDPAYLKYRIKILEQVIDLKEKERKEWADMCIKKQWTIDSLENKLNFHY